MRIALIGESHLACVKAAWSSTAHEAVFLGGTAGHGGVSRAWRRSDDAHAIELAADAHDTQRLLWGMCCGDAPRFDLRGIDAVVFVGIMFGAQPSFFSNCPATPGADVLTELGIAPISFAQWRATRSGQHRADAQRALVDMVRPPDDRPLPMWSLVRPQPRADAADYDPTHTLPPEWTALSDARRTALLRNERALVERLGAECGVRIVHPPESITIDGHFCPVRYSTGALGSRNLGGGEPVYGDTPRHHPLNINHKNRAYGALLVEQLHRCLDGRDPDFDPGGI